jgi:hypothetical protein
MAPKSKPKIIPPKISYPFYIFLGIVILAIASYAFAGQSKTTTKTIELIDTVALPPTVNQSLISEITASEMNLLSILAESQITHDKVTPPNQSSQ